MSWLWILGIFVGISAISYGLADLWKNWKLRSFSLSPAQREIVELRLEQRENQQEQAVDAKSGNRIGWERNEKINREIESKISRLLAALDEAQRNEVHRALAKIS